MCKISNTTRSNCPSKTPGENERSRASFTGKTFFDDVIDKANSVPITKIFHYYNIRLDNNNRKVTCPFLSHKGGKERTPSFNYFPETNTYYCYGCGKGRACCDFVAEMERISRINAAHKILELFSADADCDIGLSEVDDFSERFAIMLNFSNVVRDFRQIHNDEKSLEFIEEVCSAYDNINLKHELDIEALRILVAKLSSRIASYL